MDGSTTLGGNDFDGLDAAGATLRDVSEEGLLALILPLMVAPSREVAVGPGDDAAVLLTDAATILTTDSMVRDRDWRDDWSTARDVGVKLVVQNVADVAAMGGRPTGLLVTLAADPGLAVDWVCRLAEGIGAAAREAGAPVVGGDLSSAPAGTVVVSITAVGSLEGRKAVLRHGARPGDAVAVCGTLGASGAGLHLLLTQWLARAEAGTHDGLAQELVDAHRRPHCPLEEGPRAAVAGATAMIDISDGLLRDASRIAAASKVRLDLHSRALTPDIERLARALGEDVARECVLSGGEEHSLLACMPPAVADTLGAPWRVIGTVVSGEGVSVDGIPSQPRGWDHFRADERA